MQEHSTIDKSVITPNVFISYSREDIEVVKPLVALLRTQFANRVFFDLDSIPPGEKWNDYLIDKLEQADLVVVFWCVHAHASENVAWECQKAIDYGKKILPYVLDSTPLPSKLSCYQFIDARKALNKKHKAYMIWLGRKINVSLPVAHYFTTSIFLVITFAITFVGSTILFNWLLSLSFIAIVVILSLVYLPLIFMLKRSINKLNKKFFWWTPFVLAQPLIAEIVNQLGIEQNPEDFLKMEDYAFYDENPYHDGQREYNEYHDNNADSDDNNVSSADNNNE